MRFWYSLVSLFFAVVFLGCAAGLVWFSAYNKVEKEGWVGVGMGVLILLIFAGLAAANACGANDYTPSSTGEEDEDADEEDE